MSKIPSEHWLLNPNAVSASDDDPYDHDASSLPQLHHRWVSLTDERSDLLVLHGDLGVIDVDGVRWGRGSARLSSAAEIEAEAQLRKEAGGKRKALGLAYNDDALIDKQCSELNEQLAEHRAIAGKIAAAGGAAAIADRIALLRDELGTLDSGHHFFNILRRDCEAG